MGNIQREVFPFRVKSLSRSDPRDVKSISKHQPMRPQCRKDLRKVGIFMIEFLSGYYNVLQCLYYIRHERYHVV